MTFINLQKKLNHKTVMLLDILLNRTCWHGCLVQEPLIFITHTTASSQCSLVSVTQNGVVYLWKMVWHGSGTAFVPNSVTTILWAAILRLYVCVLRKRDWYVTWPPLIANLKAERWTPMEYQARGRNWENGTDGFYITYNTTMMIITVKQMKGEVVMKTKSELRVSYSEMLRYG